MSDIKVTALSEEATPISTDIVMLIDDPGGSPVSKKTTIANLTKGMAIAVQSETGTTYTFDIADSNNFIRFNNASAQALTIPTNSGVEFPIGTRIWCYREGAGAVSFSGATGVTLNAPNSVTSLGTQYQLGELYKYDTDSWNLVISPESGATDTNLGNADLTADANRSFDVNGDDLLIKNGGTNIAQFNSSNRFVVGPSGADYQLPIDRGSNNQFLSTGGNGNTAWQSNLGINLKEATATLDIDDINAIHTTPIEIIAGVASKLIMPIGMYVFWTHNTGSASGKPGLLGYIDGSSEVYVMGAVAMGGISVDTWTFQPTSASGGSSSTTLAGKAFKVKSGAAFTSNVWTSAHVRVVYYEYHTS